MTKENGNFWWVLTWADGSQSQHLGKLEVHHDSQVIEITDPDGSPAIGTSVPELACWMAHASRQRTLRGQPPYEVAFVTGG